MEFDTPRLHIRSFCEADREAYLSYFDDPELRRMMGYAIEMDEAALRDDFAWRLQNPETVLALALKDSGCVIGHLCVSEASPPVQADPVWGRRNGKSLSFALHRDYRRQGLMKEALKAVIDRLFADNAALEFVNGGWFSFNAASAALHRSLSFTPEFTHLLERNGERIEAVDGFLTRAAWENGGKTAFRKMRRFKQQLSEEECIAILEKEPRGVLAVLGEQEYPYAVPLDHLYRDGKLYFHGARSGHKLDAIRRHSKVSYCVMDEGYRREGEWALNIRSVIVFGRVRAMDIDEPGIEDILRALGNKYNPDPADVEREIRGAIDRVQMLELTIEHMTGKLVNES